MICSVSGAAGEEKEITLPKGAAQTVYTMAVRNKIMHEAGVTLISPESEGVRVSGRNTFSDIFEKFLSGL